MANRVTYPGWRAFVFGQEVSKDAISITTTATDQKSPGTCHIVLSSLNDRYVATVEDVRAINGGVVVLDPSPTGDYHADYILSNQSELDKQIASSIAEIGDPVKRAVLAAKVGVRVRPARKPKVIGQGLDYPGGRTREQAQQKVGSSQRLTAADLNIITGQYPRYPIHVGSCIFHVGDPVRVFFRDPYNPSDWYFEFSGFVRNITEVVTADGGRRVTLECEDVLRILKLARVVTNWALYDIDLVTDTSNDMVLRTWYKDHFAGLTMPELLYMLVFGPTALSADKAEAFQKIVKAQTNATVGGAKGFSIEYRGANMVGNKPRTTEARVAGAGWFNLKASQTWVWGPEADRAGDDRKTTPTNGAALNTSATKMPSVLGGRPVSYLGATSAALEKWQQKIDWKLPSSPDDAGYDESLYQLAIDKDAENDLRRVVKKNLFGSESEFTSDLITEIGEHPEKYPVGYGALYVLIPEVMGPGTSTDVMLRDLIQGIASSTEYARRLEIIHTVLERLDYSFYATPRGDLVAEMQLGSTSPSDFGKYASRYTFPRRDCREAGSTFDDEKIVTIHRTAFSPLKNLSALDSNSIWAKPGVAVADGLIPLFGARMDTSPPLGWINSEEAADYLSNIQMSKKNADAWAPNMDTCIRLGIGPNRPCYFELRMFEAATRTITNTIVWGSSVGQKLDLNFRKGWAGLTNDDGSYVLEPYGGRVGGNKVDWALLWQQRRNTEDTADPSQAPSEHKYSFPFRQEKPGVRISDAEKLRRVEYARARAREAGVDYVEVENAAQWDQFMDETGAQMVTSGKTLPAWWNEPSEREAWRQLALKENPFGIFGIPNPHYGIEVQLDPSKYGAVHSNLQNNVFRRSDLNSTAIEGLASKDLSSAAGFWQLNKAARNNYMPNGANGLGDKLSEMTGGANYVTARYNYPSLALQHHEEHGWY